MAAYTSTQNGNWSDPATWGGSGPPGDGDTATVAHTVTVDVNSSIGTSPNNTTTYVLTINAGKTLVIGTSVTLTIKGNVTWANGAILTMNAGAGVLFDNSASGGSPEYRWFGDGIYTFTASGTSGNHCSMSAISGQSWTFSSSGGRYSAFGAITASYCDFIRIARTTQGGWQIYSGTCAFANCTFTGCGTVWFHGTSTSATLTVDNCTFSGSTGPTNGAVALQLQGAHSSGTRRFSGNVLDDALTYVSHGFTFEHNVFSQEAWEFTSGYTTAKMRHNFFAMNGSGGAGNGIVLPGDVDRNYFTVENGSGNPHYIAPIAKVASTNTTIQQNVFECHTPDAIDLGDCVLILNGATTGSNKILVKNNIVLKSYSDNDASGTLVTFYNNDTSSLEIERNTCNAGKSVVARRGVVAFAEASFGAADQIDILKSNLAWAGNGDASEQNVFAERITGTVKDIITASGADYNWLYNIHPGDNLRGYEDAAGAGDMWTAGNAVAANVDNHQGSGTPSFLDGARNSVTWAQARGYGSTFASVVAAVSADTSRIEDLIQYIFEGYKPQTAGCRAAAADGACVGAANWQDSTRDLTVAEEVTTELETAWL